MPRFPCVNQLSSSLSKMLSCCRWTWIVCKISNKISNKISDSLSCNILIHGHGFRHNQNHSNWNLANILAWKTSLIIGLSYFIHFWKSFCLKLALNLSDPQTPHITNIFENFLQTILFYVNKSACHILDTICDSTCKFTRKYQW